jgi:hypothetical protein
VKKWQSIEAPQATCEIMNYSFMLSLGERTPTEHAAIIKPNLPWADRHFELERVSGQPLNPGTTWREWPYAGSAAKHRVGKQEDPPFSHSYAERYWPRWAGLSPGGRLPVAETSKGLGPTHGIRYEYGDLHVLIAVLLDDPTTRQAYLPVWFPEDLTASAKGVRVPCSIGYHFIVRGDRLHVVYQIRSCDFVRHFRDDVYLTIRLLLWVLDFCRACHPGTPSEEFWKNVTPGTFTMHITSLHCFVGDRNLICRGL